MIELTDITKVYPMGTSEVRALNGVSLRIEEGEFVAIVGASGSGKSTMMHLLGCLDRPSSGTYSLLEQTVSDMGDRDLARIRNRSVGFVFQTFNLISRMSAWENVAVPLFYARQTVTRPTAMAALERVGLTDRAGHQSNELSGGERQRVAIARAIVNQPRLILADEPTGNLDTRTGQQIMRIFHELHEAGVTVILVTHEADIAEQAERIITMRDGVIIEDRPSQRGRRSEESIAAGPATPADDRTAAPEPAIGEPVLHPSARRALTWTIAGPACLLALVGFLAISKTLMEVNPGFAKTFGLLFLFGALGVTLVAPILGMVHGRKGGRWARLAPDRFTGGRQALVCLVSSAVFLLIVVCVIALLVLVLVAQIKTGRAGIG